MQDDYPFMVAMIGYTRISAKIWNIVDCFEPAVMREVKPYDFEELDGEIMQWYESLPEALKSDHPDDDKMPVPSGPFDRQRSRFWTRLRLNQVCLPTRPLFYFILTSQLRIWLYTPVLHNAMSIAANAPLARKVVDLAKQTIRLLAHLNSETDMYRRIQVFYHQFLTSAIAVLFLASTHAPLQFSATCRDEFYLALDLVKEMSAKSWVSHRLWRTIRSLKGYAPKLGLEDYSARSSTAGGPSSTAFARAGSGSSAQSPSLSLAGPAFSEAASRAGSRGTGVTSPAGPITPGAGPMQVDEENNGLLLQSEMSRIYEGYAGGGGGAVGGGSWYGRPGDGREKRVEGTGKGGR